jgi:hypothetical protein
VSPLSRRILAARLGVPADERALLAAAIEAGTPIPFRWGPEARSIPVDLPPDHPVAASLRWPVARPAPIEHIEVRKYELPDVVVRTLVALPDGVAVGTDQGAFRFDGAFSEFPYPSGARRMRVEAMASFDGRWIVASTEAWYELDLGTGAVVSRRLPPDGDDGRDDVRAMLATDRLYVGWRCRFEGGEGPNEACALAADSDGRIWAGTLDGRLWLVDGGEIRRFGAGKGRPVRHLAFALGRLHAAADGRRWSFDGASWASEAGEPTSMAADPAQRLWTVRDGHLWADDGRGPRQVVLPMERPWCLLGTPTGALVGGPGALVEVRCG